MSQGLWGAVRKVAINTASSATGMGTVLGVHSAFVPSDSAPRVTDSQLFNPTFETNKSLIDLQLGEGGTYFAISLRAITLALLGICPANYCGCGPKARKARRERAEFNCCVKVMEMRHLQHTQEMTEAQDRLQTLSALQEKRRLEHPYPQGGVEDGGGRILESVH